MAHPMSRALSIVSLSVALLALSLALVPREAPPPPAPVATAPPRPADEVLELTKRVELLEDESSRLWDRVVALERRGALGSDGAADATLASEVQRLRQELAALSTGPLLAGDAGRAAMVERIRDVQGEEHRLRASEREALRQQQTAEIAQKWQRFASDSKLNSTQQRALEERLALEETSRKALFERADGAPPQSGGFRGYFNQRRETDRLMRDTLDGAQYEKFLELRREERPR
jgi:hypothetical protein